GILGRERVFRAREAVERILIVYRRGRLVFLELELRLRERCLEVGDRLLRGSAIYRHQGLPRRNLVAGLHAYPGALSRGLGLDVYLIGCRNRAACRYS